MSNMDETNKEKEFLLSILSLADDHFHQKELLVQLGLKDFRDSFCREVFKGFCNIVTSGNPVNLFTMAEYFHTDTDSETFRRVCIEMQIDEYINYTPEAGIVLQALTDKLIIHSNHIKLREAC